MRDQYEVLLQNIEGEGLLYNYGNYYSDASKLPILLKEDTLKIGYKDENRAGIAGFSDLVDFSIAKGGDYR